ncbi:MAG: DNA-directed RNA polymerase subunit beta' [Armatimonadota bacterium]|nr:DNA-directed RNA polymerase subunit beta' [Armatimonadota bacterium]MCX7777199.1 DNA-directed RNA polymerase subunit beta' [Armatimonadota bacterium]MDW8025026.1 DNA-directed RNA polymerase subunit beta' [Armatimonadota bacterium]
MDTTKRVPQIDAVRLSLASPQDIRSWSYGEVRKPETINYRTYRPEKDGLFCERIFGPTKDFECSCGKYKKMKYEGVKCERCGVEITTSRVRRQRMGHIELAVPVAHIWYVKNTPSPIALLLDLSPKVVERVIYFSAYIVTRVTKPASKDEQKRIELTVERAAEEEIAEIEEAVKRNVARLRKEIISLEQKFGKGEISADEYEARSKELEREIRREEQEGQAQIEDIQNAVELLKNLRAKQTLEDAEYRQLQGLVSIVHRRTGINLGKWFEVGIGAEAIKKLLGEIDLEKEARELRKVIAQSKGAKRTRAIKRLEIVEAFKKSRNNPEWMILEVLPVLPPDLRPMVQLEGGRFATSDVNDLYRRIINRNNRLKKLIEIRAPESIINHEKRLLQEAVDALIDNSRKPRPVLGPSGRPLKSLSDLLKGKEGRFRRNLLGKRVDYSGRSVIVIDPKLKLNQCGLPRVMAKELFKPFIMRWIELHNESALTLKAIKRMLEQEENELVWRAVEEVTRNHPVLLNRAPTLHRLSIEAFEPILVDDRSIHIHPLVCPPFNADFDGDQMAVHVPLSATAQAEARLLMMATNNIFSPANGSPLMSPAYDIAMGCYYLTQVTRRHSEEKYKDFLKEPPRKPIERYDDPELLLLFARQGWIQPDEEILIKFNDKYERMKAYRALLRYLGGKGKAFSNPEKAAQLWELGKIDTHEDIMVNWQGKWILTTPGRVVFNMLLPAGFPFVNEVVSKGKLRVIVTQMFEAFWVKSLVEDGKLVLSLPGVGDLKLRQGWNCVMGDVFERVKNKGEIRVKRGKESLTLDEAIEAGWIEHYGQTNEPLVKFLDDVKELGFHIATVSGLSLSIKDLDVKTSRDEIVERARKQSEEWREAVRRGEMRQFECDDKVTQEWLAATRKVSDEIMHTIDRFNPLYMMADSGARGRKEQIVQLCGMRGLMANALGVLIHDLPVTSNFREGLPLLQYFVGTFSSRRSLADTALRTADAGYLTRRLVDVAQDVVIKAFDCGTDDGFDMTEILDENGQTVVELWERIWGRIAADDIVHPRTKEVLVKRNEMITMNKAQEIQKIGIKKVKVRSPMTCALPHGICAMCYGMDLSTRKLVDIGEAVGIIAAQSIGEPGTQFTMRTFHTVVGPSIVEIRQYKTRRERALREITERAREEMTVSEMLKIIKKTPRGLHEEEQKEQRMKWWVRLHVPRRRGLLRVEELFDARRPLGQSIVAEYDGVVRNIIRSGIWRIVLDVEVPVDDLERHIGMEIVEDAFSPKTRNVVAQKGTKIDEEIIEKLRKAGVQKITLRRPYVVPFHADFKVRVGEKVEAGQQLTAGTINPHALLALRGVKAVQDYLLREIQTVYRSQGIDINDKHIEIIIRQMLRKRRIKDPGDTEFLPGQLVDRATFERENARVRAQGKQEATADWVLMGIMRAAESTESWLSAASFQRTTQALTDAAIKGRVDYLLGLKENVIIGRLIPAGTGFFARARTQLLTREEAPKLLPSSEPES